MILFSHCDIPEKNSLGKVGEDLLYAPCIQEHVTAQGSE